MKRKIITIDQEKCNGCGLCIPNCPEGALQMIDNKARLVSDLFCDGLGACIGNCPQNAITIEEREAEPYNESKVMENIVKQGENTIKAHLSHLHEHGEKKLLEEALSFMQSQDIPVPDYLHKHDHSSGCGCPGGRTIDMRDKQSEKTESNVGPIQSQLRQWPVQLQLLNPNAPYFDDAELLIAADCVPFAYGDFHNRFLKNKIVITFCPKLDTTIEQYIDKLAAIISLHTIKSITVLHMEVPCCGGTVTILQKALEKAQKFVMVKEYTISLQGEIM